MNHPRLGSNSIKLTIMLLLGAIYSGWFYLLGVFSDIPRLDRAIGVLLGLYMASHPAGNMLDLLLFMKGDVQEEILVSTSGRAWLVLNALVMLAAWFVIFLAVLLFVGKRIFS